MYTSQVNIGDLNHRPVFENWSYLQDAGGGTYKRLDNSFYAWAKLEDAGSRQFINQSQQVWSYDLKVTIRDNVNVFATSTMIWNNSRYTINSITITNNRFKELRCSKMQGNLADPTIINPIPMAYVYNYTATGGEAGFTNNTIISKVIIGAYKDGIAYKVITSGTPAPKEVKYTSTTGQFEFGDPFFDDEVAIIQYI